MSAGLVAFLNARLDDDQEAAEALDGARWDATTYVGDHYNYGVVVPAGGTDHDQIISCGVEGLEGEHRAGHVARWDPARVLAEVTAKRQIIARHTEILEYSRYDEDFNEIEPARFCSACARGESCTCCFDGEQTDAEMPCAELRLLAAVYADHTDYREDWRP